jgi:hypothetical protein
MERTFARSRRIKSHKNLEHNQAPHRGAICTAAATLALQQSEDFRMLNGRRYRSKFWPCAQ